MTRVILTTMGQKESIVNKPPLWEVFPPTLLVYTICTVMSGNGAPTLCMKIIRVRRLTEVFGSLGEILISGWYAEVRGTTILEIVVVPIVSRACRTVGTCTSDFV